MKSFLPERTPLKRKQKNAPSAFGGERRHFVERHSVTPNREARTVRINEDDWQEIVRLVGRVRVDEPAPPEGREALVKRARKAFLDRRARVAVFGNWMFSEPAWDIMLILYIEHDQRRQTVGTLTDVSGAALATVVRYVNSLVERDLIRRTQHPTDARTVFITLTEKGQKALDLYFSERVTMLR